MSNIEKYEVAKDLVLSSEYDFKKLADAHGAVEWEKEASFAVQALKNNNYLCGIAYSNPDSLKMAVVNVAAIGLTLNPVRALAYLVPRDGRVSLDVSYRGYIQLAIDSGAIEWAKAEVVCEKDEFEYNGMGREPSHRFHPFSERGNPVGAYCVVKTKTGDYLVEMMSIEDIFNIRDRSKSYQAYKKKGVSCPWVTDESEMIRKTVIRRAYKSWPIPSDSTERLDTVMDATMEDHEIDVSPLTSGKVEALESVTNKIEMLSKDSKSEKFLSYLSRVFNRKVESLDFLTEYELKKLSAILDQMIEKQKPQEPKATEPEFELEEINEESTGDSEVIPDVR
jgi:recombination protein RecT